MLIFTGDFSETALSFDPYDVLASLKDRRTVRSGGDSSLLRDVSSASLWLQFHALQISQCSDNSIFLPVPSNFYVVTSSYSSYTLAV